MCEFSTQCRLFVDYKMIPFDGTCGFRQFFKFSLLCLKNFVLAASNLMVRDIYVYVGKRTVTENDLRE